MDLSLLKKYDVAAPRYTSYPPVPFWNGEFTKTQWIQELSCSDEAIDLYIHIPYCQQLCYYCGCHRVISKNRDRGAAYVDTLIKEWQLYQNKTNLKIASLHFGGGTPNFLNLVDWDRLLGTLQASFAEDFIGSVEVDPRTVEFEQLKLLKSFGFSRLSMGIQDFDSDVQKAINREQSFDLVSDVTQIAREMGYTSVNFDLIYGLPLQTAESVLQTIDQVVQLQPDMIAWYSYAHLPERLKNQKILEKYHRASGEEKRNLYNLGREELFKFGYTEIGLDHFALKGSYLARAFDNEKLHRSFMGYTDKKAPITLGLGVSSISASDHFFVQNEKDIKQYTELVEQGELPLIGGHRMSSTDQLVQEHIQSLMCQSKINLSEMKSHPFWKDIQKNLDEFIQDGIILIEDDILMVSPEGRPFLRNLAMVFDEHLRTKNTKVKFSQSI
jgi:oxygen-independent coproporphyrinogen-3 oxidase